MLKERKDGRLLVQGVRGQGIDWGDCLGRAGLIALSGGKLLEYLTGCLAKR